MISEPTHGDWQVLDLWYAIAAIFSSFDGFTFAIMAIIVVGAGFMMPNFASIVTVTFLALITFALAMFARTSLAATDAATAARSEWNDLLALPLRTLLVYAVVFAAAIAIIHSLRLLGKQ